MNNAGKVNRDILIFLSALMLIAVFFILNSYFQREREIENTVTEPYRAELTGVQTCLPKKDTNGPVTLECALGIKTDDGEYYALDFDLSSQTPPDITNGKRFSARGVVTPIERLSSDQWHTYDIKGIFSVTDSFMFEDDVTQPMELEPEVPARDSCFVGGCSSQICSDRPDVVSDCMYRPEYACYKDAVCERQTSGQCGWTSSQTLSQCLNSSLQ